MTGAAVIIVQDLLDPRSHEIPVGAGLHDEVSGERRKARGDGPHVEIVNLDDIRIGSHGLADPADVDVARRGFHQDVEGLLQQSPRARRDEERDQDADQGVDRVPPGPEHDHAGDHHAKRAERVARRVAEDTFQVDVRPSAGRENQRRGKVAGETQQPEDEDSGTRDIAWIRQSRDRLDEYQESDDDQRDAVDQRSHHLASLEAERPRRRRSNEREAGNHEADRHRTNVGEQVAGLSKQCQRVGQYAPDRGGEQHQEVDAERRPHPRPVAGAVCLERVRGVNVHSRQASRARRPEPRSRS